LPFEGLGTASFAFTGLDLNWLRLLHLVIAIRADFVTKDFDFAVDLGKDAPEGGLAGPA